MTDIEIAQAANPLKIGEIAQAAGVDEKYLEQYGNYKAKVDYSLLKETEGKDGKLILVTAINPTPAGEGKTTTTVGLADGLKRLGKKVTVALREPSLGPVFGVKGGAAGGGYAQVIPMEDINLHFTGDFHAIGAANNLLAAMLDNHIYQGNALRIDPKRITWKRVVDMNDRQLRNIVDGLGRRVDGVTREDGYDITVASEIMAVLCLARNITDLKERLSKIIVGYTYDEEPVTAGDLKAAGAMTALLKDALKPNLVQTLEQGNALRIDPKRITWKRVVDMNDRQLRNIVDGLGRRVDGVTREDGYDITVASEIMAVLCLARNITDLKERLSKIIVGYTYDEEPVTAGDLKAAGAMTALLKDALKPNLVQTLEHTPAFIHGGPFANIAHGCNSVIATKMALKLGDYTITEAGFGADLGAEKFLDIKCRMAELKPSAVVVVATVRALKHHGGVAKADLNAENLEALEKGLPNLMQHVENITKVYGLPCVVAINRFPMDTEAELKLIEDKCHEVGVNVALSEVWAKGGEGGEELAKEVIRLCETESEFHYCYETDTTIEEKLDAIVKKIYHGDGVVLTDAAKKQAKRLTELGFGNYPICMAKTQYSFSDNAKLLGAPKNFTVTVRNLKVSAGAGFIVALTGDIMTMPGLPKVPAAEKIDVDENGRITGLF